MQNQISWLLHLFVKAGHIGFNRTRVTKDLHSDYGTCLVMEIFNSFMKNNCDTLVCVHVVVCDI